MALEKSTTQAKRIRPNENRVDKLQSCLKIFPKHAHQKAVTVPHITASTTQCTICSHGIKRCSKTSCLLFMQEEEFASFCKSSKTKKEYDNKKEPQKQAI